MRSMNASSFSVEPVISKTNESAVLSTARARKISAMRRLSTRFSPDPPTLIRASSRSTDGPSTVRSLTLWTGTSRSSWALIWAITIGVPEVTRVMRESFSSVSISATVRLSML